MSQEITLLTITAASIGFFHTLLGPDHYIPFIVMAKARKWSVLKTAWITFLCGIGHIASSVLLGLIGIALGVAVTSLTKVESFRGHIAAWVLIAFGLTYFIWGLRGAIRNKPHRHAHAHIDTDAHAHEHIHVHSQEHVHVHDRQERVLNFTPWILFTIFVFGPCEPLIPILMYPAAKSNLLGLIVVTSVFGGITIMTMLGLVLVPIFGINFLPTARLERYSHALAGATIFFCGIAIQFFGL